MTATGIADRDHPPNPDFGNTNVGNTNVGNTNVRDAIVGARRLRTGHDSAARTPGLQ
jgi:hypothetical protein